MCDKQWKDIAYIKGNDMLNFLKNWWKRPKSEKSKETFDLYLAGPMRGYRDLNKFMFTLVSNRLREMGFKVWSPSEHDNYLNLSFGQVMTIDLNMIINNCGKIALLPGWRESLGANAEVFTAFCCGKEVVEVIFNDEKTEIYLMSFDLSDYRLPYQIGETRQFDPHKCALNAFK